MPAAAIVGGAAIGAIGANSASKKAASATNNASNAAIQQEQMALDQQKELTQPYRDLGQSAIDPLKQLLGLSPGSDPTALLRSMPGYEFAKKEGLDATTNRATAMGMGLSGNTLKSLDEFSTGLADSTYNNKLRQLEDMVRFGQASATNQAANVGNAASAIGNIDINRGNTLAGIEANKVAGITGAIGGGVNNYLTYQTLQGLNNPGVASVGSPSIDQALPAVPALSVGEFGV